MRNPVIGFIKKVDRWFEHIKWNEGVVDDKTLRRWFSGEGEPVGETAKKVATWLWKTMNDPAQTGIKVKVFDALRQLDAEAPKEDATKDSFGDYFEDLAERCRSRVTLEVLVERGKEERFRLVTESGVVPVPAGSKVRVGVNATHPIFLHLVWIASQGEVTPLYPWQPGYWDRVQPHNPVAALTLPTDTPYWEINTPAGCETCVVMKSVFRVPNSVLTGLASSLKGLHTPGNLAQLPKVVRFDSANVGTNRERLNVNPPIPERDRLAWLHYELTHRLQAIFDRVAGLSFANAGGKAGKP